jgi:hypothetical protein
MIKFVVAAIWIAAATIGSVYYSFSTAQKTPTEETPASLLGGLDYVQTDIISVPVFRNGDIYGYFLGRLVYTIEPEQAKKLPVPVEPLLTDEVYTWLYGNPQIDLTKRAGLDLEAFRTGIHDTVNERLGAEVIHDVLIEQLDFLTKEEIRDNRVGRSEATAESLAKLQNPKPPQPKEATAAAGH